MADPERETQGGHVAHNGRYQFRLQRGGRYRIYSTGKLCEKNGTKADELLRM